MHYGMNVNMNFSIKFNVVINSVSMNVVTRFCMNIGICVSSSVIMTFYE